jgi:hypothetical protein
MVLLTGERKQEVIEILDPRGLIAKRDVPTMIALAVLSFLSMVSDLSGDSRKTACVLLAIAAYVAIVLVAVWQLGEVFPAFKGGDDEASSAQGEADQTVGTQTLGQPCLSEAHAA